MAAENKIPTILLEIIDQRDSGFYLDKTKGTPNEQQLRAPQVTWIPNTGFHCQFEIQNGVETPVYKEIRFIKNCPIIDKEEQDKRNIKPNRMNDVIEFPQGMKLISRQGATINEFDYLKAVFYNADSPNRPPSATAIYRAVDLNKNAEILADDDEDLLSALEILSSLRTKTGVKEAPYKYNDERIEGICAILGVIAETPAQKLYTISVFAKSQPRRFVEKVQNFEQNILTEVNQAVQAMVIIFDGNTAMLKDNDGAKVIKDLGNGKLSQETKMTRLADFLKTEEGNSALTEVRLLTALAKDQALK